MQVFACSARGSSQTYWEIRPTMGMLDPYPSWLVKEARVGLQQWIASIINASLSAGKLQSMLKEAVIRFLLKKLALDPAMLGNYRPV